MDKNYILHKYLNGDATTEEMKILRSSTEFADYVKIAESTSEFEPPNFNKDLNRQLIFRKISTSKVKKLNPLATFIKIAAVIAVLFAGYLYISTLDTSVNTEIASTKTFLLPDDSEVILNADSKLRYNKKKWSNDRSLSLEGEAYFKVKKGSKFSVKTEQGVVSVLGTQFNVFSRGAVFNINCFEGLVSVTFKDTIVNLPAGNKLKIENGTLVFKAPISKDAPSWLYSESSFENATLSTVINELQRQYPIIITSQKRLKNMRFTGSFTHTDLNLALRSIFEPLQISYAIEGNEVSLYAKNEK